MRLLYIEDDPHLGVATNRLLAEEGFEVTWVKDGVEGLYHLKEWHYDAALIDRMLPSIDGMDIVRKVRSTTDVPLLVMTALGSSRHRIEGFREGVDDYITKPVDIDELVVRLRAAVGRRKGQSGRRLVSGDIELDMDKKTVRRDEQSLHLGRSEYKLLELLMLNRGQPVARTVIEERIFGDADDCRENTVEVAIFRLRKKLGRDFIQTRRGFGYGVELNA